MTAKRIRLEQLKIASPCTADWASMSGSEQARFCNQCNKHVYNISEMTRAEAEALITATEANLCVRLYQRHDGTVITSDCPVGAKRIGKGRWRVAGVTLTAAISLLVGADFTVYARPIITKKLVDKHAYTLIQSGDEQKSHGKIKKFTGYITDQGGGTIGGATITLINEQTGERLKLITDEAGVCQHQELIPSLYTITVSVDGFTPFHLEHVALDSREEIIFNVTLGIAATSEMGVVVQIPSKPADPKESERIYNLTHIDGTKKMNEFSLIPLPSMSNILQNSPISLGSTTVIPLEALKQLESETNCNKKTSSKKIVKKSIK